MYIPASADIIPELTISTTASSDISEIVPFMAKANADTFVKPLGLPETSFADPEYHQKLDNFLGQILTYSQAELYLLRLDGLATGTIGLRFEPNYSTARIWGNRIASDMQGLGLGKILFEYAAEEAHQRGVRELAADVNMIAPEATDFYLNTGMQHYAYIEYESPILPDNCADQYYSEMRGQVADLISRPDDKPNLHLV